MHLKFIILFHLFFYSSLTFAQDRVIAPNFSFQMADGTTKQLNDYQGKVVYISFWASWCKPCISGFQKYESIRGQMEELGVVLLNVSIDNDALKWTKAMKDLNIAGDHALVNNADVQELYQLYSVPVYEIIGKKGQFLYLSQEPGRSILEEFQKFINE